MTVTRAAPEFSAENAKCGLGFATFSFVGSTTTALSAWKNWNNKDSSQAFLAVGDTSPFSFGIGGAFRHTISGNETNGFHIGAGVNLSTYHNTNVDNSKLYFNITPLGGFHFEIPNLSHILLSLDGGPAFNLQDGDFHFGIKSLSAAMGLAVHYMF